MPEPLVDVGMPAHGRPAFLAEAIDSVLGQTLERLRLTVLDDSTDGAIEAVVRDRGPDERLVYRRVEPTTATAAMTALIAAADAPYFAFLHDDDRWQSGVLERRVEFLERHPDCAFVFSGHVDIDGQGRVTHRAPAPWPEGLIPREELIPEMQRRSVVDVMHSVLARRSALERAGPRLDPDVPRLFDWELWLRLALGGPVGMIDAEDVEYRAHDKQMSGAAGMAADFADLARRADRMVAERAPELRLGERERAARGAALEISAGLDAIAADDPRAARAALGRALAADRRAALTDRRVPALLVGMALGRPGRRLVARLRAAAYRRRHARRMRA